MTTLYLTKEQAVICIDKKQLFVLISQHGNGTFDVNEHELRSRKKVNFEKVFFDSFYKKEVAPTERPRIIDLDGKQINKHDFIKSLFKHFLNEFVAYDLLIPMKQPSKTYLSHVDSYRISEKGYNTLEKITGKQNKLKHLLV